MNEDISRQAVNAALTGDWIEAVSLNLKILKGSSKDIDALNRLARAYNETGKINKAKSISKKVLRLDPLNSIATKSLAKWKGAKQSPQDFSEPPSAEAFLEDPGKTKLVTLLHSGDASILNKLYSGDTVMLSPSPHRVNVITEGGKYVGRFPDNIAARLRQLIKLGNSYRVLLKSVEGKEVKIFVRETGRGKKAGDTMSFPAEKIEYISFTPPELVHKDRVKIQESLEEENI